MRYTHERTGMRIRPFVIEDVNERYFKWFHDRETTRHNSHGLFPYGKDKLKSFMKEIQKEHSLVWAIEVPEEKTHTSKPDKEGKTETTIKGSMVHIGNVTLQRLNWIYRSAELAIVIGEEHVRGKGFGFLACNMAMQHGWERLGLHRIWTGTAETNKAMQYTAIKLGMKQEGVIRDGMFLTGKFVNIIQYGALEHERIGWVA